MFDSTISLGNILTIVSFVVIVIVYIVSGKTDTRILDTRLQMIDAQIEDFKTELKKLTEVLINQALQGGRITLMEERQLAEGRRLDKYETRLAKLEEDR